MKSELKVIQIAKIKVSPQVRKHFDENALQELAQSIAAHGVLQPILVRPSKFKDQYDLVCGERRLRGAKTAGLKDIPANIREMNDDEAFELQIIENLERKDVHPLDEADAFKKMLDSGRYQLADIAAKMAKPEKFIMNRMKLNDLVPEIKKDFFDGVCAIGHAVALSKLQPEDQLEIFTDYKDAKRGWNNVHGYGSIKQLLAEIEHKHLELSTAIFSKDADFVIAKACTGCAHRSVNNPLLFDELQPGDSCFKKSCFHEKTNEHLLYAVQDIILSGKDVVFGAGDRSTIIPEMLALLSEYKLKALVQNTDFQTYEQKGYMKKTLYWISGNDKGKTASVWVKLAAVKESGSVTTPKAAANINAHEITQVLQRADRSLELDDEKIHTAIKESLKTEIFDNQARRFVLNDEFAFTMAMHWAMDTMGTYYVPTIMKHLGIEFNSEAKTYDEIHEAIYAMKPKDRIRVMVYVTYDKAKQSTNHAGTLGQLIRMLAKSNEHVPVTEIEANQAAAAERRIAKTKDRLADLGYKEPAAPADKNQPVTT